jgi:hypothetical protein
MENLISKDKPMSMYAEKDQPIIPVAMSLVLPEDLRANEEHGNGFWVAIKGDQWHIARRRLIVGKLETVESWADRTTHFRDVVVLVLIDAEKKTVKAGSAHIHPLSFIVDSETNHEVFKKMATEQVEEWIADGTIQFEMVEAD